MTLKTLNDFAKIRNEKVERQEIVEELKAEAIKIIKKHVKHGVDPEDWEEFFNITDEDLQ